MSRQARNQVHGFDPTRARSSKSSNINIQINFNMKDKQNNTPFPAKKVDNYLQLEQKGNKGTADLKSQKKGPTFPLQKRPILTTTNLAKTQFSKHQNAGQSSTGKNVPGVRVGSRKGVESR